MSIGTQVVFQVNNVKLTRVDRFKYLGSYVSRDCMMNEEIHARIQNASCAFGRLRKRVFDCRELTVKTKVKVYDASENFDIAMTVRKVNLNSRGSETYC